MISRREMLAAKKAYDEGKQVIINAIKRENVKDNALGRSKEAKQLNGAAVPVGVDFMKYCYHFIMVTNGEPEYIITG